MQGKKIKKKYQTPERLQKDKPTNFDGDIGIIYEDKDRERKRERD